jgi:hypothetical protein
VPSLNLTSRVKAWRTAYLSPASRPSVEVFAAQACHGPNMAIGRRNCESGTDEMSRRSFNLCNGTLGSARHRCDGQCVQMPEYKVYVLRNDGRVISRINLFCDGVKRAKEWAKALEALGRLDPNRALRSDALRPLHLSSRRITRVSVVCPAYSRERSPSSYRRPCRFCGYRRAPWRVACTAHA